MAIRMTRAEYEAKYGQKPDSAAVRMTQAEYNAKYGGQAQQMEKPKRDFLQTAEDVVTSVFPGKQVGQAIGTLAGYGMTNLRESMGQVPKGTSAAYSLEAPSPVQVAGDVAAGALSVAGLKAPLPKAATVLGSAAKGAIQTGLLGAGSAAAGTVAAGGTTQDVAKNAFQAGLTGAAVGGVAGFVTKGLEKVFTKSPEALYNNALRVTDKIKQSGKNPSKFLNDEGVWGSLGKIYKTSQEGISKEAGIIAQKVANTKAPVPELSSITDRAVANISKQFGGLYTPQQLQALIDDVPVAALKDPNTPLTWQSLNAVREKLGSFVGDTKWMATNPAEKTKAAQAMYRALSDTIKEATGTEKQFSRLASWINTRKVTDRAIRLADNKYGVGLYDFISGAGGASVGALSGDDPLERLKNAAIGGVGAIALERGVNSPALKTGVAQAIQKLPFDSAGKVGRAAVQKLLEEVFSQTTQPNPQQLDRTSMQSEVSSPQTTTTDEIVKQTYEQMPKLDPTGAVGAGAAVARVGAKTLINAAKALTAGEYKAIKEYMLKTIADPTAKTSIADYTKVAEALERAGINFKTINNLSKDKLDEVLSDVVDAYEALF